jgi:hypothetical protein
VCRHLLAPHRACPCRPRVHSPPRHRKTEPPLASSLRLLGKLVLRASWLASGVRLTLSLPLRHYRTPPLVPPVSGAPPPPWDITVPPPLRPCTSSRCSGEPSMPPPRLARCRHPHGAHAAFFGTRGPPEYADQPRHECVRRACPAPAPRAASATGPSRGPVGWSRMVGRHALHCSRGPV